MSHESFESMLFEFSNEKQRLLFKANCADLPDVCRIVFAETNFSLSLLLQSQLIYARHLVNSGKLNEMLGNVFKTSQFNIFQQMQFFEFLSEQINSNLKNLENFIAQPHIRLLYHGITEEQALFDIKHIGLNQKFLKKYTDKTLTLQEVFDNQPEAFFIDYKKIFYRN